LNSLQAFFVKYSDFWLEKILRKGIGILKYSENASNKKNTTKGRTVILVNTLYIVLFVVGLVATPGWTAAQPIFNTDFETEMLAAGWTGIDSTDYGEDIIWSNRESHSGKYSLAVIKDEEDDIGTGWESPHFAVQNHQYYRVTFWAKTSQPSYWAIFFYNQYGALIEGDRYSLVQPTQQWTQQEFYFQTKFPGANASIVFQPLTEQPLFIDDVSIVPATRTDARQGADRLYTKMPAIASRTTKKQKQFLPNTIRKLKKGKPLNIILLGDSIANDLSNSLLDVLLEHKFPKSQIEMQFTGKGSTGWLKLQQQVQQRVIAHQPDLVICEAISNDPKYLADPLSRIIDKTRKATGKTEFLLITPHLQNWSKKENGRMHRNALLKIGQEKNVAVFDLMSSWERYLTQNNRRVDSLLRDSLHMNEQGRQLSARVIVDYFVQLEQGV
jgi:lysophospholipase L1-like esterase